MRWGKSLLLTSLLLLDPLKHFHAVMSSCASNSMLQDVLGRSEKPEYWDNSVVYETSFAKIELSRDSPEYSKAAVHADNKSIAKIYRIQHPYALANYFVRVKHHHFSDSYFVNERIVKIEIPVGKDINYVLKSNCDTRTYSGNLYAKTGYIIATQEYCECHNIIYPIYLIELTSNSDSAVVNNLTDYFRELSLRL